MTQHAFSTAAPLKEDYRWTRCNGCQGEIGIPADWARPTVACPRCGQTVQASGTILYRATLGPSPPPIPSVKHPSLELVRKSDTTLFWGIASILLGWTILVPLIATCVYMETSDVAKKENVSVPVKATSGFILAIQFGITQGIVVVKGLF